MDTKAKRRGRPPGTGKDDSAHLMTMARRMVADPSPLRADALREVVRSRKDWGVSDDTVLHRLREKWGREGEGYMARARQEAAEAEAMRLQQERERRVAAQPTFREMAQAVRAGRLQPPDGFGTGRLGKPFTFLDGPAFEEMRRNHEKRMAPFQRVAEELERAMAEGRAPGLTMARELADMKARGLLPQTVFDPPPGLRRLAEMARTTALVEGVDKVV